MMMLPRHRSLLHVLVLLFVLSVTLGAVTASPVLAIQGTDEVLDFGAMALTPADLEAAGREGYRLDFGQVALLNEVVALVAENRDLPEDEVQETLEDAGFTYWYTNSQYVPLDEDDPQAFASREISSYVLQFADEDGAAAGWDLLEDESGDETAKDLSAIEGFGDQAEATRYRATDPISGDEYDVLDLTIRLGALHVGVRITDWVGEEPNVAEAKALARRLLERVDAVREETGPRLSTQAIRLTGEELQPSMDAYSLLNGEAIHLSTESARDRLRRENESAQIGQTDHYQIWQLLAPGDDAPADDVWYTLSLQRFTDEDAAARWLGGVEELVGNNPNYTNFRIDDDAPTLGDESIAYTAEWGDAPIFYRSVAVRVGTTVAVVEVQAPETTPRDAVEAVAKAQTDCLEEGSCREALALPRELDEFIRDVQGTGAADDDTPTPDDERDDTPITEETPEPDETPEADDTPAANETPGPSDDRNTTPEADETPEGGND